MPSHYRMLNDFGAAYAYFSDGIVKTFFNDTGKLVHSYSIHLGWVTDFLYWYVTCQLS